MRRSYGVEPVVGGSETRRAYQYTAALMAGGGHKAVLIRDVVPHENRPGPNQFRFGKQTGDSRSLAAIARAELEHHLAMLQEKAGFDRQCLTDGSAFVLPLRCEPVMECHPQGFLLDQQAAFSLNEADEFLLSLINGCRPNRRFKRPAGISQFQTVTSRQQMIAQIEHGLQSCNRPAADNGQAAVQHGSQPAEKIAQAGFDNHVLRTGRKINQRTVEIQKEESPAQQVTRRRGEEGNRLFNHGFNLEG